MRAPPWTTPRAVHSHELRGLFEFTRRFPMYRPLLLCDPADRSAHAVAQRAGIACQGWRLLLLAAVVTLIAAATVLATPPAEEEAQLGPATAAADVAEEPEGAPPAAVEIEEVLPPEPVPLSCPHNRPCTFFCPKYIDCPAPQCIGGVCVYG